MGGEPGPADDVAGTGRLHQLLVVGGLVLFVTGLMFAGVIGGIDSPLPAVEEPAGPSFDGPSTATPDDDTVETSPDDDRANETSEEPPANETPEDDPTNETSEDPPENDSDVDEPEGDASFAITEFVLPGDAIVGDEVRVDVEIENQGDAEGSTPVALSFDGDVISEDEVTLGPDDATSTTFVIDTSGYDEGTYPVEVTVEGDRDQAWITLENDGEPSFEVVQLDIPENATIGDEVEVTYTIRNNGDERGTTAVTLEFDGDVIGEGEATLDPGESGTGSSLIDTSGYDEGEYAVILTTDHDERRGSITLEGEGEPLFLLEELTVPENATVGDHIDAEFSITNDGDASGTTNVTLAFDGDLIFEDQITLGPGESIDFTVQIDTSGYEEGEYPVRVSSEDDTQREWVTLHEEDDGNIIDL